MKPFEIRWADLPAPIGRRPVLLLSREGAYGYLNKVIIAEVTTTIRDIPQELTLDSTEGLRRPCVANFDNVHVVPKVALGSLLGQVATSREREVKRSLGYALGWSELMSL